MIVFVYGGSCCGKSEFAESIVTADPNPERVYIATMQVYDEESERRVERHRKMRAAKGFTTVEAQRHMEDAVLSVPEGATALLECLGNLSANELFTGEEERTAREAVDAMTPGLEALAERCGLLVIVSNDIFTGGDLHGEGTLRYGEALAEINRWAAARADRVYEVVCGIPVPLKGGAPA